MKGLLTVLIIVTAVTLTPTLAGALDQPATGPPLSQPLVREGTLAMRLADSLKVGSSASEAEAESALVSVGIAPRNGWISDYPVTPDIVAELQGSVADAADSGLLSMGKDDAMGIVGNVVADYNLPVKTGVAEGSPDESAAPSYPDSGIVDNYYYDEGPPVVTYYAPPPDYLYLYSWVPYPFWWWDSWFPGFFVLADFDVDFHHHGHHDGHDHHHDFNHDGHFSNHYRDPHTGSIARIDPAHRVQGGTLADRTGSRWNTPSVQRSAAAIYGHSVAMNSNRWASAENGSGRAANLNSGNARTVSRGLGRTQVSGDRGNVRTGSSFNFNRGSGTSTGNFGRSGGAAIAPRSGSGTYSRSYYSGRSFSQPASRSSYIGGGRSYSMPSRSFSAPSVSSRSSFGGGSFGGGRSSFGGTSSFGGGRSSFGAGGRGGGSFGGGMRR